nr:ESPR-type extended signal peptide-containing protein [Paraburkholderia sp. BCC1884]
MNKSYKTIWNETTGTYVAAPEVAKGRGKKNKSSKALVVAILVAGAGNVMEARAGALDGGSVSDPTAVAIGAKSYASGTSSQLQTAGGANGVAIGANSTSSGGGSIAIGDGANANFTNIAIGAGANASGDPRRAVALGMGASVAGYDSLALGTSASAVGGSSVALGAYSVADRGNAVSVGSSTLQRQIVNVAAGTQDTDAVNVKQLKNAGLTTDTSGNVTNAFVAYDSTTKDKVTLAGGAAGTTITNVKAGTLSAASTDAVNGSQLFTTNANVTNLSTTVSNITNGNAGIKYFHVNSSGADSSATGLNALAIGVGTQASLQSGIAIGSSVSGVNTLASAAFATALGASAQAKAFESQAFGVSATALNSQDISLGTASAARGTGDGAICDSTNPTNCSDFSAVDPFNLRLPHTVRHLQLGRQPRRMVLPQLRSVIMLLQLESIPLRLEPKRHRLPREVLP